MTDNDGSSAQTSTADADAALAQDLREYDLEQALAGLSHLSMDVQTLPQTLVYVAEFAVRAIPNADGAGLTLLHDGQPNTVVASAHFVSEVDEIQYRIGEGPCITAAATGRTVRSGSLGGAAQWPHFGPQVGRLGVHSALSLPLILPAGVVIGAMNVYSRTKDAFDDSAAALGEAFALPAAVSVQNARVLADAVHLAEQLEIALRSRADIDQAIGILISRSGCTANQAFDKLRVMSQRENVKVKHVAVTLVEEATRRARVHTERT